MSAADAELYDEREQQRQRQMENLQDEDSEPEDMDGPTDWVITDIRLHVTGSHRVAAQHRIKDQATASTMHSLQVDAASDPDLEKHFVNLQEEMTDTNTQLPALKFASLRDIPFCFDRQVPPEWKVPRPQGAYLQEVSRQVHALQEGLNLAPPESDFDLCHQQWDGANGKDEEYDQWPQATQCTMMLGMVQREHTSSEEFFDLCKHSSFETTLMTHC